MDGSVTIVAGVDPRPPLWCSCVQCSSARCSLDQACLVLRGILNDRLNHAMVVRDARLIP